MALEVAWTEDNWEERVIAAMLWTSMYLGLAATIAAVVVAVAACGWATRQVWIRSDGFASVATASAGARARKIVTASAVADPEGGVLISGFGGLLLRVTC